VRLHLVEEMTMEAIAHRLGISVSAAWRRFRKGAEICERILPGRVRDGSSSVW
jgi:DNA-directed RNA polymerase specialized sigma24 family protein